MRDISNGWKCISLRGPPFYIHFPHVFYNTNSVYNKRIFAKQRGTEGIQASPVFRKLYKLKGNLLNIKRKQLLFILRRLFTFLPKFVPCAWDTLVRRAQLQSYNLINCELKLDKRSKRFPFDFRRPSLNFTITISNLKPILANWEGVGVIVVRKTAVKYDATRLGRTRSGVCKNRLFFYVMESYDD